MKYFLISIFSLIVFVSMIAEDVLPKTWNKDFSISLYNGGGMYYGSSAIYLSLDSCHYTVMKNGLTKKKKFMFSAQEFDQILKKMQELKVDQIRTKTDVGITYDKATTSMCFMNKGGNEFCLQDASSVEIHPDDNDRFVDAYSYIYMMAGKKVKIK